MKKLLVVALVLALAGVFINDLGAFVNARRILVETTREVAIRAASSRETRPAAARAAAEQARERGVEVYLYDQDATGVEVWSRIPVEDTIVYARARALIESVPLDTTPMLEHYVTHPIQ